MLRLGLQSLQNYSFSSSRLARTTLVSSSSSSSSCPLLLPSYAALHHFPPTPGSQTRSYSKTELCCASDTHCGTQCVGPLHRSAAGAGSLTGSLTPTTLSTHNYRSLSTTPSDSVSEDNSEDNLGDDGGVDTFPDPFPATAIPRGSYKSTYFLDAASQSNRPTRPDKFKIPLKRCNILMDLATKHAEEKSRGGKPKVWNAKFERGDAVEVEYAR